MLTDPESVKLIGLSKQLVTLDRDVDVETPLDDLRLADPDGKQLVSFVKALEFTTLTKRAADIYGVEAGEIEPDAARERREEAEEIVVELKNSSSPEPRPTGKVTVTTPTPDPSRSASGSPSPGRSSSGGDDS